MALPTFTKGQLVTADQLTPAFANTHDAAVTTAQTVQPGPGAPVQITPYLSDYASLNGAYGADLTGASDITAMVQAASGSKKTIRLPPGKYQMSGSAAIEHVALEGAQIFRRNTPAGAFANEGAVILLTGTALSPFRITGQGGVTMRGLTFLWPYQDGSNAGVTTTVPSVTSSGTTLPVAATTGLRVGMLAITANVPPMARIASIGSGNVTLTHAVTGAVSGAITFWEPIRYPALLCDDTGYQFDDLTFQDNVVLNAFDAFRISDAGAGDFRIMHNRVFAANRVFDVAGWIAETSFVTENLFTKGIFGNVATNTNGGKLSRWAQANSELLHMEITSGAGTSIDGMRMAGNLIHGFRYGVRCVAGTLNNAQLSDLQFDGCTTPLSVEGGAAILARASNWTALSVEYDPVLGTPTGYAPSGVSLSTSGQVKLGFADCDFGLCGGHWLEFRGTGETEIAVDSGQVTAWGTQMSGTPYGIIVDNPNAVVSISCDLRNYAGSGNGIYAEDVADLTIISALVNCATPIILNGGGQVTITGSRTSGTTGPKSLQINAQPTMLRTGGNAFDKAAPGGTGHPVSAATVSAAQTIASTSATTVTFGQIGVDEDGALATAGGGVYTARAPGFYRLRAIVAHDSSGTVGDVWDLSLVAAGAYSAVVRTSITMTAAARGEPIEMTTFLGAGDTARVTLTRVSGSGQWAVPNDSGRSRFEVALIA